MERTSDSPPPAAPTAEASEDQDYVFRAQIALTEFGLRYWRYAGYLVGGVLVGSLIWGGWGSYRQGQAEDNFAQIAAIDFRMPKVVRRPMDGLPLKDDPTDAARMSDLEEGARRYEAIAKEVSGAAATLAWLKAGEAWVRAGKLDSAQAAHVAAAAPGGNDLVAYVADSVRVGDLIEGSKGPEAEVMLREMAARYSGFFAEETLIRLANLQVDHDKFDDAKLTFGEIGTRFPVSGDPAAVAGLAGRLGQPPSSAAPSASDPAAGAPAPTP